MYYLCYNNSNTTTTTTDNNNNNKRKVNTLIRIDEVKSCLN